jgi:predicted MPP superfamily phosphohydrolase
MITRRQFFKWVLGTAGALFTTGLYARFIEPYWVDYVQVAMPLPHLPPDLEGKTVVQMSDLHIGNRFDWGYVVRALQHVRQLRPDFVTYTGDFVSYESDAQVEQLSAVLQYAPPGRLGTVAVLGNHDYGPGWSHPRIAEKIAQRLTQAGITVLRNEVVSFAGLQIGGVDDWWGTNFDAEAVMAQLEPERPTVLLSHNPATVDLPVWAGYRGWTLSGHTHGGQIKPPFLPPPLVPLRNKRYVAGAFALSSGGSLYVNRALGCLWPVRFNVRPEVTIFTLQHAKNSTST